MKKNNNYISVVVSVHVICILLILLASCVTRISTKKDTGVFVDKIEGLSKDFIMGVDISSILSLEESGVIFKNEEGKPTDIFKVLNHGVSSIRIVFGIILLMIMEEVSVVVM